MPQLLLELFSEEIPARMQVGAARDLERMARDSLAKHELAFESLQAFAGPRRLTLVIDGLPAATADRAEELKGPKASAPPQALEGFLRKTGLARDQLIERDGVFYATLSHTGRPAPEIAAEIVGEIMRAFPWPKSMRSGTSGFRWVRPLKRIVFLYDGAVVPFEIDGLAAGDLTEGHRFMGADREPFSVTGFEDYAKKLGEHFVVLDAADRKRRILQAGRAACAARGVELVEDEGLLEEVSGLAEWPTPLIGDMDTAFLDLPPEVIRTSMRTHQKYFAVRAAGAAGRNESRLAPHFLVVANIEATDGGEEIKRGNAKVLSARLSDARFFWDEDRKAGAFERWLDKLKGVTFHAKLGTMAERVERIAALAREIAPAVGADPDLAERAARLAKADLASAMVGEFPELQGIMGGYYVRLAGEPDAVADAVRDHYKPVGPSDSVPTAPVTVAVALADKLDTLVGFFVEDEAPTGSKDPLALRRSALGLIGLLRVGGYHLALSEIISKSLARHAGRMGKQSADRLFGPLVVAARDARDPEMATSLVKVIDDDPGRDAAYEKDGRKLRAAEQQLLPFFADRLKVLLRDEGKRHDLVDAVFALGDDDLVRIVDRVEALSAFLATEDGANLLAGYKRAVNILRAEQKKNPGEVYAPFPLDGGREGDGGETPSGASEGEGDSPAKSFEAAVSTPIPGPSPIEGEGEETALRRTLFDAAGAMEPLLAAEDFAGAMGHLAGLRAPVDAFFDKVLVNDPDPAVRLRRLRLLASLQATANQVADFSLIQG